MPLSAWVLLVTVGKEKFQMKLCLGKEGLGGLFFFLKKESIIWKYKDINEGEKYVWLNI